MTTSDSQEGAFSPDPKSGPAQFASAPTNYGAVPWYRRNGFCSAVLIAHVAVMFLSGCIPFVSLLGIFTTLGVVSVCVVMLSGPVYYDKKRKDGTLRTWSAGNKVAAVILLLLFVGGYCALVYYQAVSGKYG
jgi:hypothetical protein